MPIDSKKVAILAVGRIAQRVVPIENGIAVEPTVHLTLTCDHRVIDGAPGAEFLATLKRLLESPSWLAPCRDESTCSRERPTSSSTRSATTRSPTTRAKSKSRPAVTRARVRGLGGRRLPRNWPLRDGARTRSRRARIAGRTWFPRGSRPARG